MATYLGDLLTRFARTERLFPPGVTAPRLETVVNRISGAPFWIGDLFLELCRTVNYVQLSDKLEFIVNAREKKQWIAE